MAANPDCRNIDQSFTYNLKEVAPILDNTKNFLKIDNIPTGNYHVSIGFSNKASGAFYERMDADLTVSTNKSVALQLKSSMSSTTFRIGKQTNSITLAGIK
jgi:hypothetical protein